MPILLGIDVGGTFTDFVAYDTDAGTLQAWKTFSSASDPGDGVVNGLKMYDRPHDVAATRLGTTIATNAILERNGARVAYIATENFQDIPFLQRGHRKFNYDAHWVKPAPLVLHRDCFGINERVSSEGEVLSALDEQNVRDLAGRIRESGEIESIAINFLYSYLYPEHERRTRDILAEELPDVPISASFDVLPKWKEYERGSTTIADAYVKPLVVNRLPIMEQRIKKRAPNSNLVVIKSNGGATTVEGATDAPVQLLLSGPSGGVIATQFIARKLGEPNIVSFDMGGTSTDCALCFGGEIALSSDFEVEWGLPVQVPMIDVRSIGAGGGSIVSVDAGGLLQVGPDSAGSLPGPVCYGKGGEKATVTDANLILGRINPDNFLGGKASLDTEGAHRVIGDVADKVGMSRERTAKAIIDIANNNILSALRTLSVERGHDPRRFALMGFGGAGPLHTADLVTMLDCPKGIVPVFPGQFSAFGFTAADSRVDRQRTVQLNSKRPDLDRLNAVLEELRASSAQQLAAQGLVEGVSVSQSFEMRYEGQNYELDLPVESSRLSHEQLSNLWEQFDQAFRERYGFNQPGETIEIININVVALHGSTKPGLRELPACSGRAEPASRRRVWFGDGFVEAPIYNRADLNAGHIIVGPAVIEEDVSAAVVNDMQQAEIDPYGNIHISKLTRDLDR